MAVAADHQVRREGPGLARQIVDLPDAHLRLLEGLAADGGLHRLAGLHEARQQRLHPLRPGRLPPDERGIAVGDEHDDDRVGAREMPGAAGGAEPVPARLRHLRRLAAGGAEAVARMPGEEAARGGGHGGIRIRQLGHDRAEFGEFLVRGQVGVRVARGRHEARRLLGGRIRQFAREAGGAVRFPAEEDRGGGLAEDRVVGREPGEAGCPLGAADQRPAPAQREAARPAVRRQRRNRRGIAAELGTAVGATAGKGDGFGVSHDVSGGSPWGSPWRQSVQDRRATLPQAPVCRNRSRCGV